MSVLQKELQTFEAHRRDLISTSENKFVLVKDEDVIGAYSSEEDAITEGYKRFGNVLFLVKQVVRVEVPFVFTSNLIAL